jgi:hypothetical protein
VIQRDAELGMRPGVAAQAFSSHGRVDGLPRRSSARARPERVAMNSSAELDYDILAENLQLFWYQPWVQPA